VWVTIRYRSSKKAEGSCCGYGATDFDVAVAVADASSTGSFMDSSFSSVEISHKGVSFPFS
jgi:hypothetical protein